MKFTSAALVLATAATTAAFAPAFRSRTGSVAFQPNLQHAERHSLVSLDATAAPEKYEFTSDVGRVMDLIINSLYSDRDIFLRELISNAADACDKKRFLSITDEAAAAPPEIKIKTNAEDNTITIEDSGVGMTKDELMNNLGKIAQSGTRAFAEALGDGTADVNLIGQFGVGFYSAYLVADKVEVITKSMQDGAKTYRWISEAESSYTIEEIEGDDIIESNSGTKLVLHMRDDAAEYVDTNEIETLLQRYSEFIEFPISVWKETTEYKKVPDEEANKDLAEGEEPKMKTVPETTEAFERVNTQKPIWLRSPREVTEDEYKNFYKSAFKNSFDDPLKHTHFVLEGQVECKSILYIPGSLPFELSKDMFDENSRNIRLYVKRVFINDQFEDLMPRWLKFVRGVVDSNDLPLNVSREILQKSKVLSIINKRLVRKSLDMIRDIAEADDDGAQYVLFWNNFGKYMKVGIVEGDKHRDDIAPLLRFYSSKSGEEYTSLDKYVENMPENQKQIYFVTGEGRDGAAMSPVVEKLTSRGFEVLFATEPLDEIMFESLRNFKDIDVVDAAKENLKVDEEEGDEAKKQKEDLNREFISVIEFLETLLSDKVQKVTVSTDLTDSPAALVQGAFGMSPTMQRYMRAQAVASGDNDLPMGKLTKAVMEINANHPIIRDLDAMIKADKESPATQDFAMLLYDVAGMTSGYEVSNMKSFAQRVMGLMSNNADEAVPEAEIVAAKEEEEEPKKKPASDNDDDDDKPKEVEVIS